MYALFLELEGMRQLSRLTPDVAHAVVDSLSTNAVACGGTVARADGNHLLVTFPRSEEEDHHQVVEAGFQVLSGLEQWNDELIGMTMIVDRYYGEVDTTFRLLRKMVSRLPHEGGIWVGPAAHSVLDGEMELRLDREFARIVTPVRSENRGLVDCHLFLRSDDAVIRALDAMEPWILGQAPASMVVIRSNDRRRARAVAEHIAQDLCGASGEPRWPALFPSDREDAAVAPFANAVLPPCDVHASLRPCEAALWQQFSGTLDAIRTSPATHGAFDRLEADVVRSFASAVQARYRTLLANLIPPVMVLENIDHFSVESVRLVRRVYDRLSEETRPFLIATSAHATVPVAFADLSAEVIALPRVNGEAVAAAADRTLSDSVKRSVRIGDSLRRCDGMMSRLYHHFVCLHDVLNYPASHRIPLSPMPGERREPGEAALEHDDDQTGELAATRELVTRLHQDERELLGVACLLGGRVGGSLVGEVVSALSFDPLRVRRIARRLVSLGLVRDSESLCVEGGSLRDAVLQTVDGAGTLRGAVAQTLLDMVASDRLHLTRALIPVVAAPTVDWLPAFRSFLREALDSRRFDRVLPVVGAAAIHREGTDRPDLFDSLLETAQLRMALLAGERARSEQLAGESLDDRPASSFERSVSADRALELSRHASAVGDSARARTLCKQAIMGYQDAGDAAGVGRANLEFGTLLLAQERITDARDYFLMTRPPAGSGRYGYDAVRGVLSEIICLFVSGYLTRVRGHAEMLRVHAHDLGMREVELMLDLIEGRVEFELGRYDRAAARFQQGLCDSRIYDHAGAAAVFRVWSARCLTYCGDARTALRALDEPGLGGEAAFFRAEALHRLDMPREAAAQLEKPDGSARRDFRSPETIDWSTGYAALEDRAVGMNGGKTVLRNQIVSFRSYLAAVNGSVDEAIDEMHRLTRHRKISAHDPYSRFYFFLYSEILPRSMSPDREDYLTILGKSVKYMQERNSRLDEYRDKKSFLSNNYWNALLLHEARTHNLI